MDLSTSGAEFEEVDTFLLSFYPCKIQGNNKTIQPQGVGTLVLFLVSSQLTTKVKYLDSSCLLTQITKGLCKGLSERLLSQVILSPISACPSRCRPVGLEDTVSPTGQTLTYLGQHETSA